MACYIFGAGDFDGLEERPGAEDYVIAADGGYTACRRAGVEPQLLLGDFDSLAEVPALPHVERVPVEKDDTDMILAVKRGLERGETLFHLYGGMGGQRTDHTVANLQALLYLADHGAEGWLHGRGERWTAIRDGVAHCGHLGIIICPLQHVFFMVSHKKASIAIGLHLCGDPGIIDLVIFK